jgi:hypothetical protein
MAITAFGFPGSVQEVEFAKMMSAVAGHGLVGTYNGTQFSASRVPGARSMSIQAGACWAPGVYVEMDATTTSPAAAANTSGLPRIDLVVMRVNWSTHAAALINIAGTPNSNPQPPAFNRQPGVVFDIPLRQAVLPSGDADYTADAISKGDRRYWLKDGVMTQVASSAILPFLNPGALIVHPETGDISVGGNSTYFTVKASTDTGWSTLSTPAPGGFTGTIKGRKRDGMAMLKITWTKTGGSISNTDFAVAVPDGWFPDGEDINPGVWAANSPVRVYFGANGTLNFNNVTIATGNVLQGTFPYFFKP